MHCVKRSRCRSWSDCEQELDRLSAKLLPKSALAQAVTYAMNQWQALCRYTEDGRLTIDNNVSERRLRDQAIGRKNWMFLGSAEAGPRAAVICTIHRGGEAASAGAMGVPARRDLAVIGRRQSGVIGSLVARSLGSGTPRACLKLPPGGIAREGAAA